MAKTAQTSRFSGLNTRMGTGLALLAGASAVPLASNRAVWWLMWTALIGVMAAWHLIRASLIAPNHRPRFMAYRGLFALAALVPTFGLLQSLVPAGWLPTSFSALRSGLVAAVPVVSVAPEASLIAALRLFGYLAFLALVIEVATRRERVGLMGRIAFVAIVGQAIWALVALKMLGDVALWGEKVAYRGMATGTFVGRNSLAAFLGFGLILGAVLIGRRVEVPKMRASRPLNLLQRLGFEGALVLTAMLMILMALVATQSRLGLVSSLAGLAVTVLLLRRRAGVTVWRLWGETLIAALLLVVGVVALGSGGVLDRVIFAQSDGVERFDLYRETLGMIAVRPWTGFGLDAFGPAFEAFRAPPLVSPNFYDMAHNSYLGLWAELGLIIGSLPPLLLLVVAVILWRRQSDHAEGHSAFIAGALGALVLGALHSLADFSLEVPANNYVFLLIIGIALGRRAAAPRANPIETMPKAGPARSRPRAVVIGHLSLPQIPDPEDRT